MSYREKILMVCSDEEKKLCASLVEVMNDINGLLKAAGEELSQYQGINKIKNIAKNFDPNGLKKIPKYIDGLGNVISDNKVFSSAIGRKLEQAYTLSTQLGQSSVNSNQDT